MSFVRLGHHNGRLLSPKYGIDGQLLFAIKLFYCTANRNLSTVCSCQHIKPFYVGILYQGYVQSPLLFIVYMNWININKCSQTNENAMIGNCMTNYPLFADDLV